ncbi:Choline/ethanolamine kinase, partial [Yasminevirus sp. GU-2018]
LSGGITNRMYKLVLNDVNYILRVYGEDNNNDRNTNEHRSVVSMFDREDEIANCKMLSDLGVGPKMYSFYNGARLEEFYFGGDLFEYDYEHNKSIYLKIAKTLSDFHKLTKETIHEKLKELCTQEDLFNKMTVITLLRRFRSIATAKGVESELIKFYPNIDEVIESQIQVVKDLDINLESVTGCHNDVHHGNMIYNREKADSPVKLIDFEYFGPNIVWYDVCNYFNELCTFSCVWSKYPDEHTRRLFYEVYLDRTVDDSEFESIEKCIKALTPINHIVWGLWAFVKHDFGVEKEQHSGFDYLGYSKMRLDRAYYLLGQNR